MQDIELKVGDTIRMWDEEEERWVGGRIHRFDDSGNWVFVNCEDGQQGETGIEWVDFSDDPNYQWQEDHPDAT